MSIADELRVEGRRPYVIPVGGSSPLGASAYAIAAEEIVADLGHHDVLVITATASGGTQAGLSARLGHDRVLGIDVGAFAAGTLQRNSDVPTSDGSGPLSSTSARAAVDPKGC